MKKCCIVGGGDFPAGFFDKTEYDLIIAADSGCLYLDSLGIEADIYIGDFDSLGKIPEKENVIKLPVEKDDTDVSAALKYAMDKGFENIDIFGGLGGKRLSHTVANIQLLIYAKKRGVSALLFGNGCRVRVLENETLGVKEKGISISVFALGTRAKVKETGMKYPFDGYLEEEFPLGVSNCTVSDDAEITVSDGIALIIEEKEEA